MGALLLGNMSGPVGKGVTQEEFTATLWSLGALRCPGQSRSYEKCVERNAGNEDKCTPEMGQLAECMFPRVVTEAKEEAERIYPQLVKSYEACVAKHGEERCSEVAAEIVVRGGDSILEKAHK